MNVQDKARPGPSLVASPGAATDAAPGAAGVRGDEAPDARAVARRVLGTEAAALARLADELPTDFDAAVEAILQARGRVIVSGMGKSGHVGRKIAATLASTGTPAHFVHPAEASHGDLGMITNADVCVLLSNSGETSELGDLLAYCARFGVPVIAICGRLGSTLMRAADFRLLLPDAPEACAHRLAPTTSTTMTLALGDALAMAVMERRGFLPEQFRTFHPGGKLGARLATVAQVMQGPAEGSGRGSGGGGQPDEGAVLPLVPEATPMGEALIEMTARGFGIALVTDESGRLAGVISDGDLRRAIDGLMERTAGEVATRSPVTIAPGEVAAEAVRLMQERRITALVVAEPVPGGVRPVGVLRMLDCLRAGVV
jgi:arabinose-5-phosphate isomerase